MVTSKYEVSDLGLTLKVKFVLGFLKPGKNIVNKHLFASTIAIVGNSRLRWLLQNKPKQIVVGDYL